MNELRSSRRTSRWLTTLALGCTILCGLVAPAAAQTTSSPEATETAETKSTRRAELPTRWSTERIDGAWPLPLEALGYGPAITISADRSAIELDVPVVGGLTATRMETTLTAGDDPVSVFVRAAGEPLWQGSLTAGEALDISLDIPAAVTSVEVEARRRHDECSVASRSPLLRLRDSVILYDGDSTPADDFDSFFGPALGSVHFVVDDEISRPVAGAMLDAAARLSARYPGEQTYSVTTARSAPAELGGPFHRTIEVSSGAAAGIAVNDGKLELTGSEDSLGAQVAMLSTGLVDAIDASEAVVVDHDGSFDEPRLGERVAISELTRGRLAISGATHLELPVVLDQSFFGGSVAGYTTRFRGIVSPPPGSLDQALQLSLFIDGELEEVIAVEKDGQFDIQFDLPSDRIARVTTVSLVLDGPIDCELYQPHSLRLDGGSWVHAESGQSLAPGFQRFPQAIADTLHVHAEGDARVMALAAGFVGQLQDASAHAFGVRLVDREEAIDLDDALLVVQPDGELLEALDAPVNPATGVAMDEQADARSGAQASVEVHLDVDSSPLPAIQAFVTPSGADALVANLPLAIAAIGLPDSLLDASWSSLVGEVAVIDPAGRLVGLTGQTTVPPEEDLLADIDGPGYRRLFVYGFSLTALVAALIAGKIRATRMLRRRLGRRGSLRESQPTDLAA